MKKMLKWYDLLKENDLLNFDAMLAAQNETESPAEESPAAAIEEPLAVATEAEEKPAKKARAKKAVEPVAEGEEKPAKKTAAKKKKED
jgi:hypothetical protein